MANRKRRIPHLDGPLLDMLSMHHFDCAQEFYPFTLNIIKNLHSIKFPTQVTFFVGENGSGKSTLLEALAYKIGFGPEGGSKNIHFITSDEENIKPVARLSESINLSWRYKIENGYFFRSESFFNVASYIDLCGVDRAYGGKSLHHQSHGESFLSFFNNRLGDNGFFIFDEPEAALSPQRQLSLLSIINRMCKKSSFGSQFIIATHSPILLAYPDATIYSCDGDVLKKIDYEDTSHYQITKQFLNDPQHFLSHLFTD